jgi:hypothetical protein
MTASLTLALFFILAAAAIAWFGSRRQAIAFALVASMALPASLIPLGRAAPWQPQPGDYTVHGARIDVDVAIYVLVSAGPEEPRYYRLPYSAKTANELQEAMDGVADGEGRINMGIGSEGEPDFSETDVVVEAPKRAERASIFPGDNDNP